MIICSFFTLSTTKYPSSYLAVKAPYSTALLYHLPTSLFQVFVADTYKFSHNNHRITEYL